MVVDPVNAQPLWQQYLPHGSLVMLALGLAKWLQGKARKWERRMKAVEDDKAAITDVKERATIAELNLYRKATDEKFAELASRLERHADEVNGRFARQDQISDERHTENVKRFDGFSRDTSERLDRIFLELARSNGIGRGARP